MFFIVLKQINDTSHLRISLNVLLRHAQNSWSSEMCLLPHARPFPILWMDRILHWNPWEAIVCWYLLANHPSRVSERWCELDFATIHSIFISPAAVPWLLKEEEKTAKQSSGSSLLRAGPSRLLGARRFKQEVILRVRKSTFISLIVVFLTSSIIRVISIYVSMFPLFLSHGFS